MKLATLKDGSRDGQLAVVSRNLTQAHFAAAVAGTMQRALDDWNFVSPQLEDLYARINDGKARHAFAFDARQCMAPLPRAYAWIDAAFDVRPAAPVPGSGDARAAAGFIGEPRMYRGAGDEFLGATDDALFAADAGGIGCASGLAVVTGDVAAGAGPDVALDSVRLIVLVSAWCLRELLATELIAGWGPLRARSATAFGPVAVTPDELGAAWRGGRVHLGLESRHNGRRVDLVDAGAGMEFHFGQLLAHAAGTRRLRAGCIVGGGSSRWHGGDGGSPDEARADGSDTPDHDGLKFGDTMRAEMLGRDGLSLFGAIEQRIALLAA